MPTTPAQGSQYTLNSPGGLGVGPGAIPQGATVTVLDVVTAGTPGVGDDSSGDSVVLLQYSEPDLVLDDAGALVQGQTSRVVSVSVTDLANIFQVVGG